MISSSAEAEANTPVRWARSQLPFYGAVCLVSYWSLLLLLRALLFDGIARGRPEAARTLPFLVTGYTTIALGLAAEIGFFFVVSAVVVVTLRLFREDVAPRPVMSAVGLAHLPLLLWVVLALLSSGVLSGGSGTALLGRVGHSPLRPLQFVAQALALLAAPELVARLAGVRRGPAMVAFGLVGVAVTVLVVSGIR